MILIWLGTNSRLDSQPRTAGDLFQKAWPSILCIEHHGTFFLPRTVPNTSVYVYILIYFLFHHWAGYKKIDVSGLFCDCHQRNWTITSHNQSVWIIMGKGFDFNRCFASRVTELVWWFHCQHEGLEISRREHALRTRAPKFYQHLPNLLSRNK